MKEKVIIYNILSEKEKNMKKKIKFLLYMIRFTFIFGGVEWNNVILSKDLKRWKLVYKLNCSDRKALAYLLWEKKEFRNLFIYRNQKRVLFRYLIKIIYPPMDTLYIETPDIGGGLFIQHGFATIISAKKMGENCWVNQQVTIGYKNELNPPSIGNNVMITCGAKILGDIVIGDNVVIGANAVVINNVESGSTVGGVPAKKLRKK